MDLSLEQENRELHEEVTTLRAGMERLTAMVESLIAAQNQSPTPPSPRSTQAPVQTTEVVNIPTSVPPVGAPQYQMPEGYPWGMPYNFNGWYQPNVSEVQPVTEIPAYKGSSCPQSHLVMYARKMSTQTDNHRLLIHYFQDSLTGAALRWYMGLDSTNIRTFNDLGEAFFRQYKYNLDMAPDRDQLQAMTQKDTETFKEYAQRWREIAAQISPPLEDKEMTKIFLKTLGSFYYERMIASAPSDFTEMVNMGMRLEEGVREGRLTKESGSSSGTRKFGSSFPKKKEQEVGMVAQGRPRNSNYQQQHIAAITPVINSTPSSGHQPQFQQQMPQQQYQNQNQLQPQQQAPQQFNNQNCIQRTPQFDPIPMSYAELFPALVEKNLVQTRAPPPVPAPLPWWYKSDAFCAFHQGAPGRGIEHYLNPNVQANPFPKHGASSVNMVNGCPGTYMVFDIQRIRESLVRMHINLCNLAFFQHNHAACAICPRNPRGCQRVRDDIQGMLDRRELTITYKRNEDDGSGDDDVFVITPEFSIPKPVEVTFNSQNSVVTPLVICPPGPIPYTSNKAIPYKYNATMIEDGREVPIPLLPSAVNTAEVSRVTRRGRLVSAVSPDKVDAPVNGQVQLENPIVNSELNKELGQSSGNNVNSDFDEVLKLIKKSEYKVVDQLMQTPSKISILSLLLNSDAHREALMKVLDQAFVDHDVTIGRFGGIVGNMISAF
ncbi:hypothetical protein TSUD_414690 [Trifolium subterraneum]|uniref:Retrotransposon gag domain-containing protein n=1 Tax=Trifolium subterraneum TaxID=3900 RepID=A0A2Z6PW76_TRISU|nr:hypothetical protein TSUD_414690 [Trifolium subterraneum]